MKGFAKVFFLMTMLFAVTSLFASVSNRLKADKHPPGYSLSIEKAPVVVLHADVVITSLKASNSTTLNVICYNADASKTTITGNEVVPIETFNRKMYSSNYIQTKTEKVTIPEAEALPDRAA